MVGAAREPPLVPWETEGGAHIASWKLIAFSLSRAQARYCYL